jgi:hypothetical protein
VACTDSYTEERHAGGPRRATVRLAMGHGGCTDFSLRSGALVDRRAMSVRAREDRLCYGTWGHFDMGVFGNGESADSCTEERRAGAQPCSRLHIGLSDCWGSVIRAYGTWGRIRDMGVYMGHGNTTDTGIYVHYRREERPGGGEDSASSVMGMDEVTTFITL